MIFQRTVSKKWQIFFIILLSFLTSPCAKDTVYQLCLKCHLKIYCLRTKCWSWNSSTLATSCKELTHWKRLWCWEGLEAGGEGDNRDEMAGWHHQLDGCEFEWTPGVGDGQGGLACCDSWGHKKLDTTEQLNWTELKDKTEISSFNYLFNYYKRSWSQFPHFTSFCYRLR